jgi:hypothetical protein
MTSFRAPSPAASEAVSRAHELARRMGGVDYLLAKAREISDELIAADVLPDHIVLTGAGAVQRYRVVRTHPAPAVRRSVRRADLKRRYPQAYAHVVTLSAPDKPYQVRLDPARPGKPAREWAAGRTVGATMWAVELEHRYGGLSWNSHSLAARVLFELRQEARKQADRVTAAKDELIQFVTGNDLPLIIAGESDGHLALRENGPCTAVDYDLLETAYPQAATLIKRVTVPGTPQIRFGKILDDDSEESARGIWKD